METFEATVVVSGGVETADLHAEIHLDRTPVDESVKVPRGVANAGQLMGVRESDYADGCDDEADEEARDDAIEGEDSELAQQMT